jgi:alpha-beta hydrolase superfamily lysophospholipase
LAAAGFSVHFPDRRGSGANPEARGHAPSAERLVEDVAEVVGAIRRGGGRVVLGGISWGAKLAVVASALGPEEVDGLVLICPGLEPRVGVGLREKLGVAGALATGQAARRLFPIPLADPALFTDNPDARQFIAGDPLSLRFGTAALLFASRVLDRMVRRAQRQVRCPALLMLAGRDRIVDNARTRAYFEGLGSRAKTVIEYPEAHHTLDFEPEPDRYVRDLVNWLEAVGLG